jgi:hypothetical protein
MAPTLVANAINAGSAFSTTYGGFDVTPPDFSFSVIRSYVADMQFVLLLLAIAWTALILRWRRGDGIRQVALVTAGNLLVNLAFFLSHPYSRRIIQFLSQCFRCGACVYLADAAGGNSGR